MQRDDFQGIRGGERRDVVGLREDCSCHFYSLCHVYNRNCKSKTTARFTTVVYNTVWILKHVSSVRIAFVVPGLQGRM